MTDAELRAKHVERFDCSLCRAEAETPHNPVWDFPSGSCRVCYEEMPCAILALLTRCEKAEAALSVERIAAGLATVVGSMSDHVSVTELAQQMGYQNVPKLGEAPEFDAELHRLDALADAEGLSRRLVEAAALRTALLSEGPKT